MLAERGEATKALKLIPKLEEPDAAKAGVVRKALQKPSDESLEAVLALPEHILKVLGEDPPLLRYKKEIGLPCNAIWQEFLRHRRSGDPSKTEAFVAEVTELKRRCVSSEPMDTTLLSAAHFKAIVSSVYPSHARSRNFELKLGNDRTSDIARFTFSPSYRIDLLAGVELVRRTEEPFSQEEFEHAVLPVTQALSTLVPLARRTTGSPRSAAAAIEGYEPTARAESSSAPWTTR